MVAIGSHLKSIFACACVHAILKKSTFSADRPSTGCWRRKNGEEEGRHAVKSVRVSILVMMHLGKRVESMCTSGVSSIVVDGAKVHTWVRACGNARLARRASHLRSRSTPKSTSTSNFHFPRSGEGNVLFPCETWNRKTKLQYIGKTSDAHNRKKKTFQDTSIEPRCVSLKCR